MTGIGARSKDEENIKIARASFELWEARDFVALVPILDENIELHEVAVGIRHVGRDGIKEMFEKWAGAYPDAKIPVSNAFASGDQVCMEWSFAGTNTGAFHEGDTVTPPTGKRLEYTGCSIVRVVGGKVVFIRHYWDQATLDRQLNA